MQTRYTQWRDNRQFAQGKQPYQRYVPQICGSEQSENYMNINWRIVSVMPKIRDSVINYISKINFRPTFNAINPEAVMQKERQKNMLWATKQLEADMKEIEAMGNFSLGQKPDTSWIPDEFTEFEALAKEKIKLQEEIKAELGCAQIFDENEWKVTERRLDEDSFDLAFSAVECRTNKNTGKIEVNYVNPEMMILPTFSGKVGENIWIVGVVDSISLYQLYQEAGDQYTVEEYKNIATYYQGRFNNAWNGDFVWDGTAQNNFSAWKSFTILRQRLYWYSVDVKKYQTTIKNGDETYRWRAWDKPAKNGEYTGDNGEQIINKGGEVQQQTVYQCSWIVGTQFCHDYGKLRDISREQMDKRQSMLPIKVYKIADQSRIERAIPFIDSMCLAWYRLQDRVARSMPAGVIINLDAIEKLTVDGKEMTTKQILDMGIQTGLILTRVTDTMIPDNGAQPLPAITPHEGNTNGIFETYLTFINEMKANIRDVTGINELMDTTTPDPKTLAGVAKISYSAVLNSLSELVFAKQYLFEKTSLDIAGKLQIKAMEGDVSMYSKQLGTIITIPQSLSMAQLGIVCEAVPTDQDREQMKAMLLASLQQNGTPMDFDDMYYINNLIDTTPSLKFAEKLISLRIKKRRDEMQASQQANIETQNKGLAQIEQQKQQSAQQMAQFQQQLNMQFEQFMTGELIKRAAADSQNRIQQTAIHSELKNNETTHKAMVSA